MTQETPKLDKYIKDHMGNIISMLTGQATDKGAGAAKVGADPAVKDAGEPAGAQDDEDISSIASNLMELDAGFDEQLKSLATCYRGIKALFIKLQQSRLRQEQQSSLPKAVDHDLSHLTTDQNSTVVRSAQAAVMVMQQGVDVVGNDAMIALVTKLLSREDNAQAKPVPAPVVKEPLQEEIDSVHADLAKSMQGSNSAKRKRALFANPDSNRKRSVDDMEAEADASPIAIDDETNTPTKAQTSDPPATKRKKTAVTATPKKRAGASKKVTSSGGKTPAANPTRLEIAVQHGLKQGPPHGSHSKRKQDK